MLGNPEDFRQAEVPSSNLGGIIHITNMEKYDERLPDYTNESLSHEIAKLRYDSVRDIIENLSRELEKQAEEDLGKGRPMLHAQVTEAARNLRGAVDSLNKAWDISRLHIR